MHKLSFIRGTVQNARTNACYSFISFITTRRLHYNKKYAKRIDKADFLNNVLTDNRD